MIKETTIVKLKYTLELLADKKITVGEQVSEVTINGEDGESIMFNQYLNTIKEEKDIVGKKDRVLIEGGKLFGEIEKTKFIKIPAESFEKLGKDINVGGVLTFNLNGVEIEGLVTHKDEDGAYTVDFNNPYAGKTFVADLEIMEVKN